MAKVSEIVSKYVISLYNGKIEGVVENILFNHKTNKAKYLTLYNADSDVKYLLPVQSIYSIGTGAISIRNTGALMLYDSHELEVNELCAPINNSVFKINGDELGIVCDVQLSDKYEVESLVLNTEEVIEKKSIANFKNNIVLVYDENNKVNINNFVERRKISTPTQQSRIVNILEIKDEVKNEKISPSNISTTPHTINARLLPNRAITNYDFLINRKVKKNILSLNGSLIIKQNTKINTATIDIARVNGKLKELTKYSA